MLASSSLIVRLMTRRPKPCRSAKPGWAPIETPFNWQSFTVSTITVGSLAWKPQATLADFTIFRTSASLPITQGPKLSPRSELILTNPALVAAMANSSSRDVVRMTPSVGEAQFRAIGIRSKAAILADVSVRYLSCGDTAFTVEFGNEISPEINGKVMALHAEIGRAKAAGSLPGGGPSRHVSIPCCYDDPEFAPDLADVAKRTKKTTDQVIAAHLASPFKVYVLGFMPGLAYVAGLDPSLYLPRRSQPRVRLPRSSVAIAMDMTTIYPFESPGGWHLIGRTPLWMFDQRREQPVFLAPGDSLSFQRIDRKSFDRIARAVEAGTFDWASLVSTGLRPRVRDA